jgi:hypothetical protein
VMFLKTYTILPVIILDTCCAEHVDMGLCPNRSLQLNLIVFLDSFYYLLYNVRFFVTKIPSVAIMLNRGHPACKTVFEDDSSFVRIAAVVPAHQRGLIAHIKPQKQLSHTKSKHNGDDDLISAEESLVTLFHAVKTLSPLAELVYLF